MSTLHAQDGAAVTPEAFHDMIRTEAFSLYVGSGVAQRWFGDWHSLVGMLCSSCRVAFNGDKPLKVDQLLELADKAYRQDKGAFRSAFYHRFGRSPDGAIPHIYRWLTALPFRSILTTNFDPGLVDANALAGAPRCFRRYPDLPPAEISSGSIFFLHGQPDSESFPYNNIILGASSFRRAYKPNSPLTHFLRAAWPWENIVLVGCSLSEPPLRRLLASISRLMSRWRKTYNIRKSRKLMIVARSELKDEKNCADLESMGIQLLSYEDTRDTHGMADHRALYTFIEQSASLASPAVFNPFTEPVN